VFEISEHLGDGMAILGMTILAYVNPGYANPGYANLGMSIDPMTRKSITYITRKKIYCIYKRKSKDAIR
jgi:hypothetical protein